MNDASLPLLSESSLVKEAPDGLPAADARRRAVRALRVALQVAGRIAREGGLAGTLHAVEAAEFKLLDEVGLEAFAACTARTFQPPCPAGVGGAGCGEGAGPWERGGDLEPGMAGEGESPLSRMGEGGTAQPETSARFPGDRLPASLEGEGRDRADALVHHQRARHRRGGALGARGALA